jgi:penicillin-insensitive murein endopeptidase
VAELSNGGDGCDDSLTWWVTAALEPQPKKPKDPNAPKKRGPREYTMADLPKQCAAVLSSR